MKQERQGLRVKVRATKSSPAPPRSCKSADSVYLGNRSFRCETNGVGSMKT